MNSPVRKRILDRAARQMARDMNTYFDVVSKVLSFIPGASALAPAIKILAIDKSTIDERLKKLETAKQNLTDSLQAIEELRAEAESNRTELAELLQKLETTKNEKAEVEKHLAALKHLAESDVSSAQRVFGVPSAKDRFWDRIVGFISGVFASIFAALLWEIGKRVIAAI